MLSCDWLRLIFPTKILAIIQRFSELCENWEVLSHQILTGRTDRPETVPEIGNNTPITEICTIIGP